jgi:prolyl-tRNA editing enzyme YbaK/EbsC (Cys-tRNA(Pro) deacylase)
MQQTFGSLTIQPALEHPELLGDPVRAALSSWEHAGDVGVAEIDPELAETAAMTEAYGVPLEASANCVVVMGRRGGEERTAACVVRATTRADVNNVVRRILDVRKASFLDHDRAVEETGMEYGGITPIGLPPHWRLLVDSPVADIDLAIVGSGIRGSKLFLPGELLPRLPGAETVTDLAR